MWARAGFAFYVLLAIFLGVVYSWNWAAFVLVTGLIPVLLIWLVAPNIDKAGDYYDWNQRDRRKK